jgi:hypothetical protein
MVDGNGLRRRVSAKRNRGRALGRSGVRHLLLSKIFFVVFEESYAQIMPTSVIGSKH